jgi:hypothetical protein
MAIHKRELVLEGNSYELSVREEPGGYFGAWFCSMCHYGGVKYELHPSVEEAFAVATTDAEKHQSEQHISN